MLATKGRRGEGNSVRPSHNAGCAVTSRPRIWLTTQSIVCLYTLQAIHFHNKTPKKHKYHLACHLNTSDGYKAAEKPSVGI